MKYTVVWKSAARRQLAEIWLSDADRTSITAAANRIDRNLRAQPLACGESRGGNLRLLVDAPLVVLFEVDSPDCKVTVLGIKRLTTDPRQN